MSTQTEFLTTTEVAARLNVHRYTVYMLLKEGRLHGFKLRHEWRVRIDEFDRFTNEWSKSSALLSAMDIVGED